MNPNLSDADMTRPIVCNPNREIESGMMLDLPARTKPTSFATIVSLSRTSLAAGAKARPQAAAV